MISTSAKLASFWSYRRSLQRCSRSAITKGGATRHRPDAYGRTEESPPIGREARAATLYSVGSARDPDHEAADALRRRSSETANPFSVRHVGHALTRAPPPRIDIACQQTLRSSLDCRPEHDAVRHKAGGSQAPKSDQQFSGKRDDHCRLTGALGAGGPFYVPSGKGAIALEEEKSPRELDQAAPHSAVTRFGEPFFPALRAALVGCAGEPSIARHGSPISEASKQDLPDQHVRGLDPDADNAGQQSHHCVCRFVWRSSDTLQPCLLDRLDLLSNDIEPRHVAADLAQCVGWKHDLFRCLQALKPCRRVAQIRLEVADAKPGQGRLHSVDNAGPLVNQARALPTRSFGIFLIDGRHGDHAAVAAFSAKPAEKHAHEHRRIEPIGLRAPMLT